VLKKTLSTLTTNGFVVVFGLLNSVLIVRVLGPSSLGNYYLILTATAVIANIANLGFNVSSSTMVAKDNSRTAALFTHSLLFSVVIGLLVLVVFHFARGVFSSILLKGVEEDLILLAILPIPLSIYSSNWGALLVGLGEISFYNKYNMVTSFLSLVLSTAALIVFGLSLKGLLLVLLVYNALLAFYGIFAISNICGGIRFRIDSTLLKESVSLGFMAHIGNIAHILFHRIDYFIVNFFLGERSLGYYGLATSIAEKIWMIVSPVYSVTFAKITMATFTESISLVSKIIRGMTIFLLVICIILVVSGHWLILWIFGGQYLSAYIPMVILLPGVLFFGVHWFLSLFFIGHLQKPLVTTLIAWIGMAICLPLYYVLTLKMGINGTALASSLTYLFVFLATFIQYKKVTGESLSDVIVPRRGEILGIIRESFSISLVLEMLTDCFPKVSTIRTVNNTSNRNETDKISHKNKAIK
jgi:O-antigen/teichoic acid export membrane protein